MDLPIESQNQQPDQPQTVGQIFFDRQSSDRPPQDRISPTAKLYPNVRLGQNVVVEDFCIIGKPPAGVSEGELVTVIGDNAVIRSHTVIYAGNTIGNNFLTGHQVLIREQNKIGDNVRIGSQSNIEHHITIANNVRVHSKVFIPEYSTLQEDAWIGPGVMMTNAPYPRSAHVKEQLNGPIIERAAKIGAGSVLLPGITVGEEALIGAGSVVTKDVPPGMVAYGSPAQVVKRLAELRYKDTNEAVYQKDTSKPSAPAEPKIPLVDLYAQYQTIKGEIDEAIARVIAHSSFVSGEEVEEFEKAFAAFCGMQHCVAVSNGTTALDLILKVLGIGPGDEVITTPMTFIATTEAIVNLGAKPVFVDIDEQTYNLDPRLIEAVITSRTKAIVPVHLYGQPADMPAIHDIARRHNLLVVEDCAQAHGAEISGHKVPLQIGTFSFYPGKNLGAYGDAGAIVLNDEQLALRLKKFRDHGRSTKYEHDLPGTNARMDGLQGAILQAKLPHLAAWVERRRALAKQYTEKLRDLPILLPHEDPRMKHAYHLCVIRLAARDQLLAYLKEHGIAAGIHYPIPLHLQPVYRSLGYQRGDLPITERVASEVLSLPLYPELTQEQVERVCRRVREFFAAGVQAE